MTGSFNETYVLNGLQTPFDANMEHYDGWGGPDTYPHFHAGRALAGNTPFQYFKQIVHRGGIQDTLVAHWPKGIKAKGEVRQQYHHIKEFVYYYPGAQRIAAVIPAVDLAYRYRPA